MTSEVPHLRASRSPSSWCKRVTDPRPSITGKGPPGLALITPLVSATHLSESCCHPTDIE